MIIFDAILIIIVVVFIGLGYKFGAIHTFGAIIGAFIGAFLAGMFYEGLGLWLQSFFGLPNLMRIFAFIFIFLLINRLIGFIFYVIDKVFKFLSIIPFLKTINRLLGAILGFVESLLVIGLSLYMIARFPLSPWFTEILQTSLFVPWFIKASVILQFLLPEVLRNIKSVI